MNELPPKIKAAKLDAIARGKTTYMGRPCKHNHSGLRYAKTNACVSCQCGPESYYQKAKAVDPEPDSTPERWRETNARYKANNRERVLWQSAKYRAARKGLEFDLKPSHIVIPETCPVLGIPMTSPSLDRFDNTIGYTKENVRVISKRANTLKNNATAEELRMVLDYLLTDTPL